MNVMESVRSNAPIRGVDVKALILEDVPADAELIERTLRDGGLVITAKRVETKETYLASLDQFAPDIVLADYKLPTWDGLSAIELTRKKYPEIPIVVVTGALEDEAAVQLIKAGASDYVMKDRLARLPTAVKKAILEAAEATKLRLQEVATQSAEKKLYVVAAFAQDAIIMMNEKMVITFWNKSAEKCFGYLANEAIGRDFYDLLTTGKELKLIRGKIDELVNAGQEHLAGVTYMVKARKKDGSCSTVDLSISLIRIEGKWNAIVIARPHLIQL